MGANQPAQRVSSPTYTTPTSTTYIYYTTMDHLNHKVDTDAATRTAPALRAAYDKQGTFSLADKDRKYSRQYFSMYQHRLTMLKPRVDREATRKWGHNVREVNGALIQHKEKILDIMSGELCWVSGTVFADMKHKLNIFADVESGTDDVLPAVPERYVAEGEMPVIMLEDESGRAILHNEELLLRAGLVTGCLVAVLGIEIQAGVFEVMELAYPVPAPQAPLTSSDESWVAFVSGLQFGPDAGADLRTVLLQQWLGGELGGADDSALAQRVSQLVVLGGAVAEIAAAPNPDFLTTNNFGSKNVLHFLAELVKLFGAWLAETVALVPVAIMPGASDPCEMCLPQQPMHRSLFGASRLLVHTPALRALTNPAWLELGGVRAVATAGQNIDDMLKYSLAERSADSVLAAMARNLRWQNIVPTAPDTLHCYPYDNWDPFTLDETPHLYVVGNQREAGHRTVELKCGAVTAVCVPRFCDTGEVVMVNTRTLEVKVAKFGLPAA